MPIRTFLGRQCPIHSQHAITYSTIIEIREVCFHVAHEQTQRIYNCSILNSLNGVIEMNYLACNLAREKPLVPAFLIDADSTSSNDLNLGERITGRQSD